MVEICAPPSFISCFERCLFWGFCASSLDTALNIFALRSAADARVKVTISIFEISAGESGSVIALIIRCVSVVVFPEPAAALKRRVLFFVFIAAICAAVHVVAIKTSLFQKYFFCRFALQCSSGRGLVRARSSASSQQYLHKYCFQCLLVFL